jgi:hypothetical protein
LKIERAVITTFPGYFFSTILTLQAVYKYLGKLPVSILIDDFDHAAWPNYVDDVKSYVAQHFDNENIDYKLFSQLHDVDSAKTGGWFRQQLIKLHLDQMVNDNHWLLIDGDTVLDDIPDLQSIPLFAGPGSSIDIGNRKYVEFMLAIDQPYFATDKEWWCASSVPFRYVSRELLTQLRQHVEKIHNENFLQLHINLMKQHQLVAFDPEHQCMIMSEFQLMEIYRHRVQQWPYLRFGGASAFRHDSVKDWNRNINQFVDHGLLNVDQYWSHCQQFGKHHV